METMEKPRRRIINLIELRLSEDEARAISYIRKSYWNTSKSIPLHKAITNKNLKLKGLVFIVDHYLKLHTVEPPYTEWYGGVRGIKSNH